LTRKLADGCRVHVVTRWPADRLHDCGQRASLTIVDLAGSLVRQIKTPEITTYVLDDGLLRVLTHSGGGEEPSDPVWAPDGQWLAYSRERYPDGVWDLWAVPAGGGAPRPVTSACPALPSELQIVAGP
jgi:hypothetical protein